MYWKKIRHGLTVLCAIVGLILLAHSVVHAQGGFCNGWADGYTNGYCHNRGYSCVRPVTPVCPVPYAGQTTYSHGYNRGFIAGLNAR